MKTQSRFNTSGMAQRVGLLLLAFVTSFAYLSGEPVWYGDAPYYADDISKLLLIEPGHLFWRPLGALVFSVAAFFGYRGDILGLLQVISFLASVGSVLASYSFLSRWTSPIVSLWGSAIVAFSNGFWGYSVSGSSYTAGLLFALLALILATPPKHHTLLRTLLAGVCGGVAALFWLVYGLIFPVFMGLIVISINNEADSNPTMIVKHLSLFLFTYGVTVGLPLVGCTFLLPILDPHVVKELQHEPEGFLDWLASSSHGIRSPFGLVQVLRWVLGWAQSVIAFGDIGQSVRLWIIDGVESKWRSIATASVLLLSFYCLLGLCILKLWRHRRIIIQNGYVPVLMLILCSIILNSLFALSWQATDYERYLPSLPFLVLAFCVAMDLERGVLNRLAAMVLSLLVLVSVNWNTTIYPAIGANSVKNQWLKAIHQHLKKEDLLIVLGTNKSKIMDPHSPDMPKINNVSMKVLMHSSCELCPRTAPLSPQTYKDVILNDIQEARTRGGQIFIGDSVLGLDPQPRDGWSFREHPDPSPKDLDDFFSPMKGQFAFSVAGERVWKRDDRRIRSMQLGSTETACRRSNGPIWK